MLSMSPRSSPSSSHSSTQHVSLRVLSFALVSLLVIGSVAHLGTRYKTFGLPNNGNNYINQRAAITTTSASSLCAMALEEVERLRQENELLKQENEQLKSKMQKKETATPSSSPLSKPEVPVGGTRASSSNNNKTTLTSPNERTTSASTNKKNKSPSGSSSTNVAVVSNTTPARVAHYASDILLTATVVNPHLIVGGKSYDLLDDTITDDIRRELKKALPLPKPIIVVGMPKAGTTSISEFFRNSSRVAGGYRRVSHWSVPGKDPIQYIGVCLMDQWNKHEKMLHTSTTTSSKHPEALQKCGNFDVWAQIDITKHATECYFPQITHLEQIHQEFPHATFLLNRRDFDNWYSSVERWRPPKMYTQGFYNERLARCTAGPLTSSKVHLIQWHQEQIERVRQFVYEHPSHALLEVDIEDPTTGLKMAKAFNTSARYWGQANTNKNNTSAAQESPIPRSPST